MYTKCQMVMLLQLHATPCEAGRARGRVACGKPGSKSFAIRRRMEARHCRNHYMGVWRLPVTRYGPKHTAGLPPSFDAQVPPLSYGMAARLPFTHRGAQCAALHQARHHQNLPPLLEAFSSVNNHCQGLAPGAGSSRSPVELARHTPGPLLSPCCSCNANTCTKPRAPRCTGTVEQRVLRNAVSFVQS